MPVLKEFLFFHVAEKAYSDQLVPLYLLMSWYLYGYFSAYGYYSALYGYCSVFECLEIKTACYFDKTQVFLFPFYRLKGEK